MSWDAMLRDTTPWPETPRLPSPEEQARERLYEAWRGTDPKRFGVMARQGFYAGWRAHAAYETDLETS